MVAIRHWSRPGLVRRPVWGELLLVAAILALALVVRLPYLWDVPRFTDETAEARIGLRIAGREAFPLTNRDPYIGALWNYLLAAGFLVSGPSLFTPRAIIAVVGALTIVPTYLLGRTLGGGRAGSGDAHTRVPAIVTGALAALLLALA